MLDVDGDGDLDIIGTPTIYDEAGHPIVVLLNDGAGGFIAGTDRLPQLSGDTVVLEGASGDYAATLLGSFVTITDGDTSVSIPVGLAGLMVDFADADLELRVEGGQVMLGEDVVTLANDSFSFG